MAALATEKRLTLVLEINRFLPAEQKWPRGVKHAIWMQDPWVGNKDITTDIGKSDHIFFLIHPRAFGMNPDRSWSILSPGVRTDVPAPAGTPSRCDFSFCGYIPRPINHKIPVAVRPDGKYYRLKEFLEVLPKEVLAFSNLSLSGIRRAVAETCQRLGCELILDSHLIFEQILIRMMEREHVLKAVLGISQSLEIWGAPHWVEWPEFAPYYKGSLPVRALDTQVYQASRVNIHTGGLALHFRTFDCLAAGGFLLVNKTGLDDDVGGINHVFRPDIHYGSYDMNNIGAVAERYLRDPEHCHAIATQGRQLVMESHTWKHRAAQILTELGI